MMASGGVAQAQWGTSGTNIYNTNSGNVGVGGSAPVTPLEVYAPVTSTFTGNARGALSIGVSGSATNLYYRAVDFLYSDTYPPAARIAMKYDGNLGSYLYFGTSNNTGSGITNSALVIDPNANVGIGTTSPSEKLHVAGGSLSVIRNEMSSWLANNSAGGETDWLQNAYYSGGWKYRLADEASRIQLLDGKTIFSSAAAGSADAALTWTDNLSILQNGSVGIGTTVPAQALEVKSSGGTRTRITMADGTSGGMELYTSSGTFKGGFLYYEPQNIASFYGPDSGSAAININSSGNVGVGTTNATKKLQVLGDIDASGEINGGTITAKYQDVAEWVPASHALLPGTVVTLDPTKSNHVEASSHAYDTRVAGVVSAQPGITLGEQSDNKVLVATTGRVKVMVDASNGPIQVGDLLVTSDITGVAKKSEPLLLGGVPIHRPGTLIGKALEPLAKGRGEILVLLSLQ
jgi:hypothetical protein